MAACIINPSTGKPYTRHLYTHPDVRVESYSYSSWHGSMQPHRYYWTRHCKRVGCKHIDKGWYGL